MRMPFLLGAGLAVALFVAGFGLAGRSSAVELTARLNAAQETPAPKAAAHGSGLFTATLSGRSLAWRLTFARLSGRAVAAHIHLGRQGVAGPVAVPLCGPCVSGAHRTVRVTPKLRAALLAGAAYVNVHTPKNPGGEIRGQVAGPHGLMPAPPRTTSGMTTSGTTTDSGGYGY
jgi:CHRD domain